MNVLPYTYTTSTIAMCIKYEKTRVYGTAQL